MQVKDYMSRTPVTIDAGADYKQAFAIMQEKGMHHLPVIDDGRGIVGIVARRDLQVAAQHFREAPVEVQDVMHSPVTTIPADADLVSAVDELVRKGIGCLPVTDDEGKELLGIITEVDLLRALRELLQKGS